jgi:hypothetical protein
MNIEQYLRYIRDNNKITHKTLIDNVGLWPDIYIATRRQYTG